MAYFQRKAVLWAMALSTAVVASGVAVGATGRSTLDAEYEFTARLLEKARARVADLESRLNALAEQRARLHPPPPPEPEVLSCEPPFEFDSEGIKRWRADCPYESAETVGQTGPVSSCESPFRVDLQGVKHVRPECVATFREE